MDIDSSFRDHLLKQVRADYIPFVRRPMEWQAAEYRTRVESVLILAAAQYACKPTRPR